MGVAMVSQLMSSKISCDLTAEPRTSRSLFIIICFRKSIVFEITLCDMLFELDINSLSNVRGYTIFLNCRKNIT